MTASLQQCHCNWLDLFWTANSIENNVCSAAEQILKPDRRLVASPHFLWENVLPQYLVCLMGVCRCPFPVCLSLTVAKRLRWPLRVLSVRSLQLRLISSWYHSRRRKCPGIFYFSYFSWKCSTTMSHHAIKKLTCKIFFLEALLESRNFSNFVFT